MGGEKHDQKRTELYEREMKHEPHRETPPASAGREAREEREERSERQASGEDAKDESPTGTER